MIKRLKVCLVVIIGNIFNIFNTLKIYFLSVERVKNASHNNCQTNSKSVFDSDRRKCFHYL